MAKPTKTSVATSYVLVWRGRRRQYRFHLSPYLARWEDQQGMPYMKITENRPGQRMPESGVLEPNG